VDVLKANKEVLWYTLSAGIMCGAYPGSFLKNDAKRRINKLLNLGVRSFVDLTEQREATRNGWLRSYTKVDPMSDEDILAECAKKKGIVDYEYAGFPIRDGDVPSYAVVDLAMIRILRARSEGKIAYVHCRGGIGRTGVIAAIFLGCEDLDCNPQDKLDVIRSTAGIFTPSPENGKQREFVDRYLQTYREKRHKFWFSKDAKK